jgi:CubicO group peptidase (beta-lactamase class C family)
VDGETVIDLWGGTADADGKRPWQRDTLVNVYSTAKGLTALCAHVLVDRQEIDLDAPVAAYWPDFAQQGTARRGCLHRHLRVRARAMRRHGRPS